MQTTPKRPRRLLKILAGEGVVALIQIAVFAVLLLIYFSGRQTPIALTLATGIGVSRLQARVDQLEDKAIRGVDFTDADQRFLKNLYTCFAKGGRLILTLRQSSRMMHHYLSGTGEALATAPRVFTKSRPVQEQMLHLRERILCDLKESKQAKEVYASETFYMGDPEFFDSFVGLYFGRLVVHPEKSAEGKVLLRWRAEVPWEWPSYESLFAKYGDYHAQCFPIPNVRAWLFGPEHCLLMDDGLGGHLATLGLAKPFLLYSEWSEEWDGGEGTR